MRAPGSEASSGDLVMVKCSPTPSTPRTAASSGDQAGGCLRTVNNLLEFQGDPLLSLHLLPRPITVSGATHPRRIPLRNAAASISRKPYFKVQIAQEGAPLEKEECGLSDDIQFFQIG